MSSTDARATAHGRAMGCACEVIVVGGHDPVAMAARGLEMLGAQEQRWSRFLPSSDISRLNAAAGSGTPVTVHHSTRDLLLLAVHGWSVTGGRFDPTVHHTMRAMGYDRSYELVGPAPRHAATGTASPGCDGIEIDVSRSTVRLPDGVGIDAGGIGKGFAADMVAAHLRDRGAHGVAVNVGGDVRVTGVAPNDDVWVVGIEDPFDPQHHLVRLRVPEGGVAVSSRLTRTWVGPGGEAVHHVLDPRTGRSTAAGVASSMVLAGTTWWAEVLSKAAMVEGIDGGLALLDGIGDGSMGLLVGDQGELRQSEALDPFIARPLFAHTGSAR